MGKVTAKYAKEITQLDTKAITEISLLKNKVKALHAEKKAIYDTMIPKVKHQADMNRFEAKLFAQYTELDTRTSAEIAKLQTKVRDLTHEKNAIHTSCASFQKRHAELNKHSNRVPGLLTQISELKHGLSAVRRAKTLAQQNHRTVKNQMKEMTVRSTLVQSFLNLPERNLKKRMSEQQLFDAANGNQTF